MTPQNLRSQIARWGAATPAPTVSVIVCTYNRPAGLRRALASVWRQDVREVEVIIVDDGSDEPVRLPEPPHGEIRLIRTEHRGVGAARAVGLATARGVFVAYCDDDDEWTPDHLATLLAYLLEHPDVALVYGDAAWTDAEPRLPDGVSYPGPWLGEANQIRATDVVHRASAARDVGGFDPLLRAYEDLDLWRRVEEAHVLRHLPVVVATHSLHAGRVTACDHPKERERLARYYERSLPSGGRKPPGMPTPTSFDPTTWQPGRRELVWQSPLNAVTSFGLVGRQLVLAAERAGIDVMMAAPEERVAFPEFARFFKPLDGAGRIGFIYQNLPNLWRSSSLPAALVIIYAPCETTLVPRVRVDAVEQESGPALCPLSAEPGELSGQWCPYPDQGLAPRRRPGALPLPGAAAHGSRALHLRQLRQSLAAQGR